MKRREALKASGKAIFWATPVVSSVYIPAHAILSEPPRAPTFELIDLFPFQTVRPNLIVRLSDDRPGISWRQEVDSQLIFNPPTPPVYQPGLSGNTGSQRSVDLEFIGGSQFTTYMRLFATDVDGNSAMFEQVFTVA